MFSVVDDRQMVNQQRPTKAPTHLPSRFEEAAPKSSSCAVLLCYQTPQLRAQINEKFGGFCKVTPITINHVVEQVLATPLSYWRQGLERPHSEVQSIHSLASSSFDISRASR